MVTLAFLFIFLLSVSIAALTVSPKKQEQLLRSSWQRLGNQTKAELQVAGNCCGFLVLADLANTTMSHPPCVKVRLQLPEWTIYYHSLTASLLLSVYSINYWRNNIYN